MKRILKLILFLSFSFCLEIYSITIADGKEEKTYESVYFIDFTAMTLIFETIEGEEIEVNRSKLKEINNSNGERLQLRDLKKSNPNLTNNYTQRIQTESAGELIFQAGNELMLSEVLPLVSFAFVNTKPEVAIALSLGAFVIRYIAYQKLSKAGKIMAIQEQTND